MQYYLHKLFVLSLILGIAIVAQAQEACSVLVEEALEQAAEVCANTGRNQACYGNSQLVAVGRSELVVFEQVGDIADVNEIESISTTSVEQTDGVWGLALLRLQANFPDTLPGQNVTVLLFGDASLINQTHAATRFTVTANANANVRNAPVSGQPVTTLAFGMTATAFGRNEAGDWIRIAVENNTYGWVASFLLNTDDTFSDLPVVDTNALLPPTPMQSVILQPGIGGSSCRNTPEGVLIHTPHGSGMIEFTVNGVTVNVASTIRIRTLVGEGDPVLQIQTFDGNALVSNAFGAGYAAAGTQVSVQLDATGTTAVEAPSQPEAIPQTELDQINTIILSESFADYTGSETINGIEQALNQQQVQMLSGIPEDFSTLTGTWLTRISLLTMEAQDGVTTCVAEAQGLFAPFARRFILPADGSRMTDIGADGFTYNYTRTDNATYFHQTANPALNDYGFLLEATFTSPVTFMGRYEYSWVRCYMTAQYTGIRIGD